MCRRKPCSGFYPPLSAAGGPAELFPNNFYFFLDERAPIGHAYLRLSMTTLMLRSFGQFETAESS